MTRSSIAGLVRTLLGWPRAAVPPLQTPGLYHYRRVTPEGITRFHLRAEPDGGGLLLCNATAAARLTPAGVIMVHALLEGVDEREAVRRVTGQFRGASRRRVEQDLRLVKTLLQDLTRPKRQYPIMNLEDPALSPRASRLMAPFQAGITLADPERILPILARLWGIGVAHVNFRTATHPVPGHLLRAVERAEDMGMIAGTRIIAGMVNGEGLLRQLVTVGLDHVMVPLASTEAAVHDAMFGKGDHHNALALLEEAQRLGTCAVVEVPLTRATSDGLEETLRMVAARGVANVSVYAIAAAPNAVRAPDDPALSPSAVVGAAIRLEGASEEMNVRYLWQPPVQRDPNLAWLEQLRRGPRATGDVSIRVEPDGSVIPPRGPQQVAGNLLHQPWGEIWKHEAFRRYRERVESNTRCSQCPGLVICSADCPREPLGWSS